MGCSIISISVVFVAGLTFLVTYVEGRAMSHYCYERYTVRVSFAQRYYYWCGPRRYTRYRRAYKEVDRQRRTCCQGWRTCYCNVPICDRACSTNGGFCNSPGACACPNDRTGRNCQTLDPCNRLNNCYPGSCNNANGQCECSSGFFGGNCIEIRDAPTFDQCDAFLHGVDTAGVNRVWKGSCNQDRLNPNATVVYVNTSSIEKVQVEWQPVFELDFVYDTPQKPRYIQRVEVGISSAYAQIPLGSNRRIPCAVTPTPSSVQPHLAPICFDNITTSYNIPATTSVLPLTFVASTGGHKVVYLSDGVQVRNQTFAGEQFERVINFVVDTAEPVYCETDNSCPPSSDEDYNELLRPIFPLEDTTMQPNFTLYLAGWSDRDTDIADYTITVYRMEADEADDGRLKEVEEPILVYEIESDEEFPNVFPEQAGMYSAVVSVRDLANNIARARTLILLDTETGVEVVDERRRKRSTDHQSNFFMNTANPAVNYTWINTKDPDTVTVQWGGHFRNQRHVDNGWLNAVAPFKLQIQKDDVYDNRTTQAVQHVNGIREFYYGFHIDRSGAKVDSPPEWIKVVNPLNTEVTFEAQRDDGDSIKVFVQAIDSVGHSITDNITVHVDSTGPFVEPNAGWEPNVDSSLLPFRMIYGSSGVVTARDPESGIGELEWTLTDLSDNNNIVAQGKQFGQKIEATPDDCAFSDCECIPMGECFPHSQRLFMDNCLFLTIFRHRFKLTMVVNNQAGISENAEVEFGPFTDVNGIGDYPPPDGLVQYNETDTTVTISWYLPIACYEVEHIVLVHPVEGDKHILDPDTTSYTIGGLQPSRDYTVSLYTRYSGDEESERVAFQIFTAEGTAALSAGAIAGVSIAALVLLVILLLACCIGVIIYYRRHNKPLPTYMTHVENRLYFLQKLREKGYNNNRNSDQINGKHNLAYMEDGKVNKQLDAAHDNPYMESHPVKAAAIERTTTIEKKMAFFRHTMAVDTEEDVYIYGTMDFDETSSWKPSPEMVTITDTVIASGRFAVIKEAALNGGGNKTKVAAKMLKDGHSDEDRFLLTAKMNFLAAAVPSHVNIVNLIGATPEDPVLFLELCDMPLTEWVKQYANHFSEDVNSNMINFTLHIANALEHLHGNDIIHRRLALRNVFVYNKGSELIAKVTGFGPLRGEQEGSDHKKEKIPIKWMAPESLEKEEGEQRTYNEATDMWSYCITVWELFSMGEAPYAGIRSADIKNKLAEGFRLSKPDNCSDWMFNEIVTPCWSEDSYDRPEAGVVVRNIEGMFENYQDGMYYDDPGADRSSELYANT